MNVLSLFSGVGGLCSLGLGAAGHEVVGLCEIDPKARSVLRRHHPNTPIWGDVTTLTAEEITEHAGTIDLVCGGSPCQDLSIAGRREGLGGDRSGLLWHQCRIADQLAAPWVVWENVAGTFSSNGGSDFAAVLWGLTGALPDVPDGGWRTCGMVVGPKRTAVWRLLDAQWFGVAQRRRRVFVVAGPRKLCGPEILALAESVSGHPRPSRTTRQEVAGTLGGGDGGRGRPVDTGRMTFTPARVGGGSMLGVAFSENQRGEVVTHEVAHSLSSAGGGKPGQGYPAVAFSAKDHGADATEELAPTLRAGGFDTSHMNGGVMPAVAMSIWQAPDGSINMSETHPTLQAYSGAGRRPSTMTPDLAVRRLTPRECERLMGWPDDWTRYDEGGAEIADSHRYRMCGNGVVAPVAAWIGQRIPELPSGPEGDTVAS